MDNKQLDHLFISKEQRIAETAAREQEKTVRQQVCRERYSELVAQFQQLMFFATDEEAANSADISMGRREHPEFGPGLLQAKISKTDHKIIDAQELQRPPTVTISFRFVPEGYVFPYEDLEQEAISPNLPLDRGDGFNLNSPEWHPEHLRQTEELLDWLELQAQATLGMLIRAASDPILNPEMAERVQAFYKVATE